MTWGIPLLSQSSNYIIVDYKVTLYKPNKWIYSLSNSEIAEKTTDMQQVDFENVERDAEYIISITTEFQHLDNSQKMLLTKQEKKVYLGNLYFLISRKYLCCSEYYTYVVRVNYFHLSCWQTTVKDNTVIIFKYNFLRPLFPTTPLHLTL